MVRNSTAFTLVELLVVITIIVVLLALLTPALDKAVYQAELTVCGANQKGVCTALNLYAWNNRRHYPLRPSFAPNGGQESSFLGRAKQPLRTDNQSFDDRPFIMPYMSLKLLLCPLAGGNNIDLSIEANNPETFAISSYNLYWGWGYGFNYPNIRAKATWKVGDRFEWAGDQFSALVSDLDNHRIGAIVSAHPDDPLSMILVAGQNVDPFSVNGVSIIGNSWGRLTVSWWVGGDRTRGLIDRHVGYQDCSVERFNAEKWGDDRMTFVPNWQTVNSAPPDWQQLPVR